MLLSRPLASIDIETTGTDPVDDRIVEFGVCVLGADGSRKEWAQRFNPTIPIKPEATEVHGITDEMVAGCPVFADFAAKIHAGLQGKDLLVYNGRMLDLPMLDEELRRCGLRLDLTGVAVVDAFHLFCKQEPRDLAAYVERFARRKHEGHHGALPDAVGTLDGFMGHRQSWDAIAAMDLPALSEFCLRDENKRPADLSGKLYRDKSGDLRYAFGAHRDKRVLDEQGFAFWMMKKNFPRGTIEMLEAELNRITERS